MIAYICGVLTGIIASGVTAFFAFTWREIFPNETGEPRYGHPVPPVRATRKALPKPPEGHVWEISTEDDKDGQPVLKVCLLSILSGEVESRKWSLVHSKYGRWAKRYRSYPLFADDTFKEDFLGPIIDWATSLKYKHGQGFNLEYEMRT